MYLRRIFFILFIADDLVLVAEDFLLGLQQLQIGRSGLWDLVVVFDLEFVGHYLNYICQLCRMKKGRKKGLGIGIRRIAHN